MLVTNTYMSVASTEVAKSWWPADFVLAQCRPDVTAEQCFSCLRVQRDGLVAGQVCATGGERDGICLLRYDVQEFYSTFDRDEPMGSVFDAVRAWQGLTKDVVYDLLEKVVAANGTMAKGSRTVAGIADYLDGTVYGLAQCTVRLSAPDRSRCLRDALFRLSEQFNSSAGMQVLRPSCMLQYNSSLFFNTSLLPVIHVSIPDAAAPPSSQASSPSSKHGASISEEKKNTVDFGFHSTYSAFSGSSRFGIVPAVLVPAVVLAAALSVALCFFKQRWRNRKSTSGS